VKTSVGRPAASVRPSWTTTSGELTVRVPYDEPIDDAEGLRKATVKLAHRARGILDPG